MRTEHEMMSMFIDFAVKDDRIRLVTLEGSRTNKNIPPDQFQDYDVSYFVADMDSFKENVISAYTEKIYAAWAETK